MKKQKVKWKPQKQPPSFPKGLKAYHLLLFAVVIMLLFGAIIKQMSEV